MTRAQEPAELRPGLPPVELRRVWRTWITNAVHEPLTFTADGMKWGWGGTEQADMCQFPIDRPSFVVGSLENLQFAPFGASWSEVEALAAKAAEVRS